MDEKDEQILQPMKDTGVDTFLIPADVTTYSKVIHETENVDERRLILERSAGLINIDQVPQLETQCMHLAGISDSEFDLDLILALKAKGMARWPARHDPIQHGMGSGLFRPAAHPRAIHEHQVRGETS